VQRGQQRGSASVVRAGHGGTLVEVKFGFAVGFNKSIRDRGQNLEARSSDIRLQHVKSGVGTARAKVRHDIGVSIIILRAESGDANGLICGAGNPGSNRVAHGARDIQHHAGDRRA